MDRHTLVSKIQGLTKAEDITEAIKALSSEVLLNEDSVKPPKEWLDEYAGHLYGDKHNTPIGKYELTRLLEDYAKYYHTNKLKQLP